ncbi:MAG: hypothetical protein ACM3OO_00495 [Planctomycetaceae bacterium]
MGTVATKQRQPSGVGLLLRVPVSLWLVVALMAVSFGAGVIVRTLAEPTSQQAVPSSQFSQILAPPLTDQQLSQGTLPSGHPDLSGATQGGNGGGNGGASQGSGQNSGK